MSVKKQTYINNYFKIVPKINNISMVPAKHCIANVQNMKDISVGELTTLNQMKSIVNKLGLNSIVIPFPLPSYTINSEISLGKTDPVNSTNKSTGNEKCQKRSKGKKPFMKAVASNKPLSPAQSINKPKRKMSKSKLLEPINLFKETSQHEKDHSTECDATLLPKTVLKENQESNTIFDKSVSVFTSSMDKTLPSTKEPSRDLILEKDTLNNTFSLTRKLRNESIIENTLDKTLLLSKEPLREQILEKDILDKTLSPVKLLGNSDKIQILNDTVLIGKKAIPMDILAEVRNKTQTNIGGTLNNNSPTTSKVNVKTEPVVKREQWNTRILDFVTQIIKYVAGHKCLQKLLTKKETDAINELLKLARREYLYFCIRLFTRKKKWYNVFKLKHLLHLDMCDREVMDMYTSLSEHGFVDINYTSEPIESLLSHMQVGDIRKMCAKFKLPATQRQTKEIMMGKLLEFSNRQTTLTYSNKSMRDILLEDIQQTLGPCVKINIELYKVLQKIHLLYKFVSPDFETVYDLYLFMERIKDGAIVMPQITVNENYEVFSSISSFSSFQAAFDLREEVLSAVEKKLTFDIFKLCSAAYDELRKIVESSVPDNRPSCIVRYTPGHQYASALSTGLKHLTKHYPTEVKEWLQYLIQQPMYCRKSIGSWYNTLITVQSLHLKQREMANDTLIKALQETSSIIDLTDLNDKAERIKHSQMYKISQSLFGQISALQPILIKDFPFVEIDSKAIRSEIPGRKRDYFEKSKFGSEFMGVEQVALKYYFKNGFTNGLHCEGTLLVSIFFILFWDIIYGNTVPYAFICEIQYYPLDLLTKEFYTNRETEINQRLSEIESGWSIETLNEFICDIWEKHSHEKSFINTSIVNEPKELVDIILCIDRVKLCKIMQRLALNFRIYRSGLPDLFLWNVSDKKCKFVEVKGENDKLSSKQKCWLDFLRSIDLDIEVCHVHTMGSKRRRRRVRNLKTEKEEKNDNPKKLKTN